MEFKALTGKFCEAVIFFLCMLLQYILNKRFTNKVSIVNGRNKVVLYKYPDTATSYKKRWTSF